MRKLILIAAISCLATQAHAGGSRSLSLAAVRADQPAAERPTTPATTAQAPVMTATTTPAPVTSATTTSPASTPAASGATGTMSEPGTAKPETTRLETTRPKHRQPSVEARVIRELHRHGIYW